jgi:hypothetical protein
MDAWQEGLHRSQHALPLPDVPEEVQLLHAALQAGLHPPRDVLAPVAADLPGGLQALCRQLQPDFLDTWAQHVPLWVECKSIGCEGTNAW